MNDIHDRAGMALVLAKEAAEHLLTERRHGPGRDDDHDQGVYNLVMEDLASQEIANPDDWGVCRTAKELYRSQKPPNVRDALEQAADAAFAAAGIRQADGNSAGIHQTQGSSNAKPYHRLRLNGICMTNEERAQALLLNDEYGEDACDYHYALLNLNATEMRQKIYELASTSRPAATRIITELMRKVHCMQTYLLADLNYLHCPCPPLRFDVSCDVTLDDEHEAADSSAQQETVKAESSKSATGQSSGTVTPKRKNRDTTPSPTTKASNGNGPTFKKAKIAGPVPEEAQSGWCFGCCDCDKTFGKRSELEAHESNINHARIGFQILEVDYEQEKWRATCLSSSKAFMEEEAIGDMVLVGKGKGVVR